MILIVTRTSTLLMWKYDFVGWKGSIQTCTVISAISWNISTRILIVSHHALMAIIGASALRKGWYLPTDSERISSWSWSYGLRALVFLSRRVWRTHGTLRGLNWPQRRVIVLSLVILIVRVCWKQCFLVISSYWVGTLEFTVARFRPHKERELV